MKIIPNDITSEIGQIHPIVEQRIWSDSLEYDVLTSSDFYKYILEFVQRLNDDLVVAGEHRQEQWNAGWTENLREFQQSGDIFALVPKYHQKSNIARLHRGIIKARTPWFDYKLHSYFVDGIIFRYLGDIKRVIEIGCGTGYHLYRFNQTFPKNQYLGTDWATSSQEIIAAVGLSNVTGQRFDYFHPDGVNMYNSLLLTIASLEQIQDQYAAFLDYVLDQRPALCVHFEPIAEVLDPNDLIDYLTIKYIQKRNYLKNYLTTLRKLEEQGKIHILATQRLNYGSKFIEGHTCIIWKPA